MAFILSVAGTAGATGVHACLPASQYSAKMAFALISAVLALSRFFFNGGED